jgi:SNF2 family DNA or RNA helicase
MMAASMWFDPQHNVLVYQARDPRILQYIPAAKMINGEHVMIPVTMTNLQIMRVLGYPVIRPLDNYDWPRTVAIKAPFHAQIETANFLAVHPRACCFSDMGTGKTLAALWAADALMRDAAAHGQSFRALVVAPLSTLQTVWADAIFKNFMGRRKALIVHGSNKKRCEILSRPADFYIINNDGIKVGAAYIREKQKHTLDLKGFSKLLATRQDIQLAIVDEAANFRNHTSLRSKVARALFHKIEHLWLMTGTPTPQGPLDAYGIAMILNGAHNEAFTQFRRRIMYRVDQFKWSPKVGANEAAHELMKPSIRFKLEDCQDVPSMTVQLREAPLSVEQSMAIHRLERDFILEVNKGTVTAVHEAALRIKIIQIACGAVYDEDHEAHHIDCGPRIETLKELIEEAGGKVIIFAPFTSVVDMLNTTLQEYSREVIDGRVPFQIRNNIIYKFQNEPDPKILIAQPETIQEGQTLTAAATIIWFAPVDKTKTYIQACERIHRPGQTRHCVVINLAATDVEMKTYHRLEHNQSMQGILLELVEGKRK